MKSNRPKILFVTWDGPQTNYLPSLFLPIFKGLIEAGYGVSVLQFTWDNFDKVKSNQKSCKEMGINYKHVNVLRKPSAAIGSFFSAWYGKKYIVDMVKQYHIDVVMPRSTLPALSTLLATKHCNTKLLFDADGLPLDERVDFAGVSPTSIIHRIMRDIEQQTVVRANAVITRSRIASTILRHRAGANVDKDKYFEVTNGRSSHAFKPFGSASRRKIRHELDVKEKDPVIVYAGSLGSQYCMHQMYDFYKQVKLAIPTTKLLVLSAQISSFKAIVKGDANVIYRSLTSDQVPEYLSACDIGLAIREQSFSMQGVAPIKLGEYLMCGIPIVATDGIGDTSMISDDLGFLLKDNSDSQIRKAAMWFVKVFEKNQDSRCIAEKGARHFSLENTIKQYVKAIDYIS
ncbi:glycosyltransferase [uncultured Vibrio sp.]|uniref:glycosyltransferase n=1 Tax=uncultured Vibrio sp. TaxID=114054 RepID=UPI002AAC2BB6|nr:glycosyltransferase [uncultured Vibrio sp.]